MAKPRKDEDEEEFEDNFEDEEEVKEVVKKPFKKPEKDEYDDNVEEEEDEVEEEEKPKTRGRPMGTFKKSQPQITSKDQDKDRYSSYHYPERAGIKDDISNESIGETALDFNVKILNYLDRIAKSVGA